MGFLLKKRSKGAKRKELLMVLSDFGISYEDLIELPNAIKLIKEMERRKAEPCVKEHISIKEQGVETKEYATPEQILEMFSGETEVLNFDGRK